jgi:hypothetical protein
MARFVLAGVVAMVLAGSAAAAVSPPFVLRDGQTAYFLPGANTVVRCVVHGAAIEVRLPRTGASAGGTTGSDRISRTGGASISTETRPNGASRVRCGSATAGTGFFGRSPNAYVIGKNGLDLIRGPNTLAALQRVYGRPVLSWYHECRATWKAIGLVVRFSYIRCGPRSVLANATARGLRWRSLDGVQVGDSVAKLAWEAQGAKPLGRGRWLLGSGGTSHHARLVAVTSVGAVARLVLSGA